MGLGSPGGMVLLERNLMQEKVHENQDVVLESASALMDGEASELDLHRVLKAAARNPDVAGAWQRYHLVRASLQQDLHSRPAVNLLAGINQRLAEDQRPLVASVGRRFGGTLRRLGQGAIAASVAFTVLYTASYLGLSDAGSGNGAAVAVQQAGQPAAGAAQMPSLGGDFTPSELSRTVSMDAAARKRLQQAVYQSSMPQDRPFGEPYIFPETESVPAPVLPVDAAQPR